MLRARSGGGRALCPWGWFPPGSLFPQYTATSWRTALSGPWRGDSAGLKPQSSCLEKLQAGLAEVRAFRRRVGPCVRAVGRSSVGAGGGRRKTGFHSHGCSAAGHLLCQMFVTASMGGCQGNSLLILTANGTLGWQQTRQKLKRITLGHWVND